MPTNTIHYKYLQSVNNLSIKNLGLTGKNPSVACLIVDYSSFTNGEILTSNTGQTARVLASAADGFGSRVTFGQGVIFAKDHFIAVPATSLVVGEYNSNTANFRVGFKLTESITTSNTDKILN